MKRVYLSIVTYILCLQPIWGQYHEIGAFLGVSNYWGDLMPPRQFLLETNFAAGLSYHYNIHPHFSVRGQALWGSISGDDRHSAIGSGRRKRNLDFRSALFELSGLVQVNILPFQPSLKKRAISPYGFVGLVLFHFNPHTVYKGEKVFLQPLGTEGQGISGYASPYQLWQVAVPFGLGVKLSLTHRLSLMIEGGMRKTFTDYLDDVSGNYADLNTLKEQNGRLAAELSNRTYDEQGTQLDLTGTPRGNAGKDWYTFMGIQLSYSLQGRYYYKPRRKR